MPTCFDIRLFTVYRYQNCSNVDKRCVCLLFEIFLIIGSKCDIPQNTISDGWSTAVAISGDNHLKILISKLYSMGCGADKIRGSVYDLRYS